MLVNIHSTKTKQRLHVYYYLSRVRAADDHKVKKFTEFLPCTFAMYDCRQLKDVTSVENVHRVTDLLPQVFIRCFHLLHPSSRSVVPQAFGAL